MNQTGDMDAFLYEDILFARLDGISDIVFLENSYAFRDYYSSYDDDENELSIDQRSSYIIDAWGEFVYKHFYQNQNTEKALICYIRKKELSVTPQSSSSYFNPLLGSYSERMGDVYTSMNDLEKALGLYKEALNLSMEDIFVNNAMTTARCMCKIGRYSSIHQSKRFNRAFQHVIHGYGKPYTKDTIEKCYVCLARSLQRCARLGWHFTLI
ncbi:unnamed protein product [Rotaria socialis]|uniref:Tetratricopeptide repeat protein n=3 Tax=Rotaria socialis TaxID=392032 RepID=A0A817YYR3_9BILA|nr:unnamed protein product [Rotaria socialis]